MGTLMHNTPSNGSMIAVRASEEQCAVAIDAAAAIDEGLATKVAIASVNCSDSTVLAGDWPSLSAVIEKLTEDTKTTRVTASHADHSPLMSVISAALKQKAEELCALQSESSVVVLSTVTGAELMQQMDAEYWVTHNVSTVRFSDAVKGAAAVHERVNGQPKSSQYKDPLLYFIEMGDGMLCRFATKIMAEKDIKIATGSCLGGETAAQEEHFNGVVDECMGLVQQAELNAFMIDPLGADIPSGFAHLFPEASATA